MGKIALSAAVVAILGISAMAESYPAEGVKSYTSIFGIGGDSAFDNRVYAGVGYSYIVASADYTEIRDLYDYDFEGNAMTLQVGYGFNRFIAIEGRYTRTLGDLTFDASYAGIDSGLDFDGEMSNIALYVKPMYTTPQLSAYALIGFGQFDMNIDDVNDNFSESGFQWGGGVNFHGGEHLGIFLDYIRYYSDSSNSILDSYGTDLVIDSFNVGLNYKF